MEKETENQAEWVDVPTYYNSSLKCNQYPGPYYRDGGEIWKEVILSELTEDETIQQLYQVWIDCGSEVREKCKLFLEKFVEEEEGSTTSLQRVIVKRMIINLSRGLVEAFDHWSHIQDTYGACGGSEVEPCYFHSQIKGDLTATTEFFEHMLREIVNASEIFGDQSEEDEETGEDESVKGIVECGDHGQFSGSGDSSSEMDCCSGGDCLPGSPVAMSPLMEAYLESQEKLATAMKIPKAFEVDTDSSGTGSFEFEVASDVEDFIKFTEEEGDLPAGTTNYEDEVETVFKLNSKKKVYGKRKTYSDTEFDDEFFKTL